MKKLILISGILAYSFLLPTKQNKKNQDEVNIKNKKTTKKEVELKNQESVQTVLEKFVYFYNHSEDYYSPEDLIHIICSKCFCDHVTPEEQQEIKKHLFTLTPEQVYEYLNNKSEEVKNIFHPELYTVMKNIEKNDFVEAYSVKLAIAYLLYAIFDTNIEGYEYPFTYFKNPKIKLSTLLSIIKLFLTHRKDNIITEINKNNQIPKSTIEAMFKEANEFFSYYITKPCSGMGQYLMFLKKINDIYSKFFTLIFASKSSHDKNKNNSSSTAISPFKAPLLARHMASCFTE